MTSSLPAFLRSSKPHPVQNLGTRSASYLPPAHIQPIARPNATEAELRLERELSQLLSRPPTKRRSYSPAPFDLEPDSEPSEDSPCTAPFVGAHLKSPTGEVIHSAQPQQLEFDGNTAAAREDENSRETAAADPSLAPRNANWLDTARRARRNRKLQTAASWVVTILVGGFIIGVAAAILFGLPEGTLAFREQTVLAASPELDSAMNGSTPVETRWHLD